MLTTPALAAACPACRRAGGGPGAPARRFPQSCLCLNPLAAPRASPTARPLWAPAARILACFAPATTLPCPPPRVTTQRAFEHFTTYMRASRPVGATHASTTIRAPPARRPNTPCMLGPDGLTSPRAHSAATRREHALHPLSCTHLERASIPGAPRPPPLHAAGRGSSDARSRAYAPPARSAPPAASQPHCYHTPPSPSNLPAHLLLSLCGAALLRPGANPRTLLPGFGQGLLLLGATDLLGPAGGTAISYRVIHYGRAWLHILGAGLPRRIAGWCSAACGGSRDERQAPAPVKSHGAQARFAAHPCLLAAAVCNLCCCKDTTPHGDRVSLKEAFDRRRM